MIGTALDGEEVMRRELLVLVTTLDRLVVTRGLSGTETAPLRCTAIAHPPGSWRNRVLYGPRERTPQGYRSCSAHRIDLRHRSFTLDGQFYHPAPTGR